MKNKILLSIIVFFVFFFFSCFNVSASEWLELSPSYCTSSIQVHRETHPETLNIAYNNSAASVNSINYFRINCNFDNTNYIVANHQYRFSFILGSGSTIDNTYSQFPYLISVGRNFILDTNMLFNRKDFTFTTLDNTTLSRSDLTDSIFSMSYSDDTTEPIYYINFSLVSPSDLLNFTIDLVPNNSLLNTNSQKIWQPTNIPNSDFKNELYTSRIFFDYGEFLGYENPEVCIGDECIYSPYLGYSNNLIEDSVNTGGSSLRNIISNAWSNIQGFVTSSYYILSLCTTLFTSLPSSIQSVLIFTFTIGMIVIVWKVIKS